MNAVEPFYVELGHLIEDVRTKRKLSKAALGRRLQPELSRASIANIESGKQRVLVHTLIEIANALDVELSELIPARKQKKKTSQGKLVPIEEIVDTLRDEGIPRNTIKEIRETIEGDKK
ncbi:MAG: helix-turn-helix domain-containing protein [Acidobacteria bacterium]|nr:helix-turn-helix domain-containing protein [Acidobacteriota bacterium]